MLTTPTPTCHFSRYAETSGPYSNGPQVHIAPPWIIEYWRSLGWSTDQRQKHTLEQQVFSNSVARLGIIKPGCWQHRAFELPVIEHYALFSPVEICARSDSLLWSNPWKWSCWKCYQGWHFLFMKINISLEWSHSKSHQFTPSTLCIVGINFGVWINHVWYMTVTFKLQGTVHRASLSAWCGHPRSLVFPRESFFRLRRWYCCLLVVLSRVLALWYGLAYLARWSTR